MNKKIARSNQPDFANSQSAGSRAAFQFQLINQRDTEQSICEVFELAVKNSSIGYLYLNSSSYSLVWKSDQSLQFNEPFFFVDLQFSHLSGQEIRILDPILPKRKRSDVSGRLDHFSYGQSIATLAYRNGGGLIEYDLLNDTDQQEYLSLIQNRESSSLIFARYDLLIVSKNQRFECCFTAESCDATVGIWEFAVSCPRSMRMKERTLKWIARTHHEKAWVQRIDFKASVVALNEVVALNLNPSDVGP